MANTTHRIYRDSRGALTVDPARAVVLFRARGRRITPQELAAEPTLAQWCEGAPAVEPEPAAEIDATAEVDAGEKAAEPDEDKAMERAEDKSSERGRRKGRRG